MGLEFAELPARRTGSTASQNNTERGVVHGSYIQINEPGVYLVVPRHGSGENVAFLVIIETSDSDEVSDLRLAGANDWAIPELTEALARGLVTDAMIGNWTNDTSRLQAADAMVKMIESVTGKTIDQVAAERGFDMNDRFADTDSRAATFLKASGISSGVDGVNYGVALSFSRAQMVTMLGRMAENIFDMDLSGFPLGSDRFLDLGNFPWADAYVGWAAEVGITQGTHPTKFGSSEFLQNQQLGVFMNRAYDVLN
jgi:hypothetical protein